MIIRPRLLARVWGIHPQTIIHVGSHDAEELPDYERLHWGDQGVIWFEALPSKESILRRAVKNRSLDAIHIACLWSSDGEVLEFRVANNGQSSSALEFGLHATLYPNIHVVDRIEVVTRTGDSFNCFPEKDSIGLLNIDVQGAEMHVLKGFSTTLARVDAVYSEVNTELIYEDLTLFHDLDAWLTTRGFLLCDWSINRSGWGDALWVRSDQAPRHRVGRRMLRRLATGPRHTYFLSRNFLLSTKAGQWLYRHTRQLGTTPLK